MAAATSWQRGIRGGGDPPQLDDADSSTTGRLRGTGPVLRQSRGASWAISWISLKAMSSLTKGPLLGPQGLPR